VVDTNTAQNSDYLRQTLLSRPNLEQVLHLAQLDIGKSQPRRMPSSPVLPIRCRSGRRARTCSPISYTSTDPLVAKNVVESLLTIFGEKAPVRAASRWRRRTKFLDDQIAAYEVNLRGAEQPPRQISKRNTPTTSPNRTQACRNAVAAAQARSPSASRRQSSHGGARDNIAAQLKLVPQLIS